MTDESTPDESHRPDDRVSVPDAEDLDPEQIIERMAEHLGPAYDNYEGQDWVPIAGILRDANQYLGNEQTAKNINAAINDYLEKHDEQAETSE
jgi:uncharacterized protein (DUF2164 family)